MLSRGRATAVAPHLDVDHVLLIRVLLQIVDLTNGLPHLPRDYFRLLHPVEAGRRDRSSLLTTVAVRERGCIGSYRGRVLGTQRLSRVEFLGKCLVLLLQNHS